MPKKTSLVDTAIAALEDLKAIDIKVLHVSKLTSITDHIIICSGTSNRHVNSIANNVVSKAKAQGIMPLGLHGQREGEWVLVDLNDVIVHIMLPDVRAFYNLETLWSTPRADESNA